MGCSRFVPSCKLCSRLPVAVVFSALQLVFDMCVYVYNVTLVCCGIDLGQCKTSDCRCTLICVLLFQTSMILYTSYNCIFIIYVDNYSPVFLVLSRHVLH